MRMRSVTGIYSRPRGAPAVEAARVFSRVKPRLIGTENVTNSALRVMPEL
jgi:hypothetical protein